MEVPELVLRCDYPRGTVYGVNGVKGAKKRAGREEGNGGSS
jgi:hypothetical protein